MAKVVRMKTLQCVAENGERFTLDVSRQWLHQKSHADEPLTFVALHNRPRPAWFRLTGLFVTSAVMYGMFWIVTRAPGPLPLLQELCGLAATLIATVATARWFGLRTD